MTLEEVFDFLNFWINKTLGSWYTISELTELTHRGQIAYFTDLKTKYSTSQRIKDALAPFKETHTITNANSTGGLVEIDADTDYQDLLDIQIHYALSGRGITVYVPVATVNEDERAERLNSQLDPVTVTNPICEQVAPSDSTKAAAFQLYPQSQYDGKVTFLRLPVKPVFGYSVISGRVIVYDSATSTQLEWGEQHIIPVLLKALASVGINLSDEQVSNFAQIKSQENFVNVNRL
jgi:hypothetical protein